MDVTGLLDRANLLLQQGRNKDAEKQVMQVLDQEPNNDHALSILARCYMNNDEVDKGIEIIDKAIAIEPMNHLFLFLVWIFPKRCSCRPGTTCQKQFD
jgi:Tfp pilus assembly protein PilF